MPNVFEINEYEINKNQGWVSASRNIFLPLLKINVACGFYAMYFPFNIKEKFVGPVKKIQDQKILGVTGPTGPVTV